MSRRCVISKSKVQFGNSVSHSNRKTRRPFLPNTKKMSIWSDILKRAVVLTVNSKGIRTLEHNGGLDNYLLSTPNSRLSEDALRLKKVVQKLKQGKAAA